MQKSVITEVTQWAESMIKSGKYPASTGKYRISALETFASILGPDEATDAESILSNLDDIALRWATKHLKTGETTGTYQSRVKGLLADYLAWKKDPSSFRGRRASVKPAREQRDTALQTVALAEPKAASTADVWETINLGDGRIFKFVAPSISVKDAARVAWALAVRATDFDPTNGSPFGGGLAR